MKLNKYIFIILIISKIYGNDVETKREHLPTLKSPILHCLDGVRGCIDGIAIGKMLYICQEILTFQSGERDKKTKARVGQHKYNGKLYTLRQLITIEDSNPNSHEVKDVTNRLKENFIGITKPFLIDASGTKQQIIALIQEFCQTSNRKNSLLLTWSSSSSEDETFRQNINSLKSLDTFCEDLTVFLKVLMNSCPKAIAEWKKKNQHR